MAGERVEGLVELLGIEEENPAPGRVICRMTATERHRNIQGVVHGSVTMALLDTAMGHAISTLLAPEEFCSTTQFSIQYLRAVRPGDRLVAEGHVVRKGRRIAYLEGTCRTPDDALVARALGTWYVGRLAGGE